MTWFDHAPHMTSCSEINDCAQCGKNLADYLISTLGLQQFVLKRPRGELMMMTTTMMMMMMMWMMMMMMMMWMMMMMMMMI